MARYILIRVLGLIGVLLIVSVITFVLMHGVPGGPWQYGERPFTDQQLAALKKLYGLDRPLVEQYFSWLRGVLRLDFGQADLERGGEARGIGARRTRLACAARFQQQGKVEIGGSDGEGVHGASGKSVFCQVISRK